MVDLWAQCLLKQRVSSNLMYQAAAPKVSGRQKGPSAEAAEELCITCAASRQSFKEQEALVYQQLAQLIRDGVWLKSYLAAVMRLQQEAYLVGHPSHANLTAKQQPCDSPGHLH